MTGSAQLFRLAKVAVAEQRVEVSGIVDIGSTIVSVKGNAMDAAQDVIRKIFLVGAAAMAVGGFVAMAAPSLAANWLANVGLIVFALGALVAAGASERYHRG